MNDVFLLLEDYTIIPAKIYINYVYTGQLFQIDPVKSFFIVLGLMLCGFAF